MFAPGDEVTVREVTNRNSNGYATNTRLARPPPLAMIGRSPSKRIVSEREAEYVLRTSNGS